MKIFLLDFELAGKTYSIDLPAEDLSDAERRLDAIRDSGRIIGELVERCDAEVSDPDAYARSAERPS